MSNLHDKIFNNPYQRSASMVRAQLAPVVVDRFQDDEGETQLVLENGNTIAETKYNALWNPQKGRIRPKDYKEQSPAKKNNSNRW